MAASSPPKDSLVSSSFDPSSQASFLSCHENAPPHKSLWLGSPQTQKRASLSIIARAAEMLAVAAVIRFMVPGRK
ncbi:hypothetical protein SESBI_25693 [Sesbania bispinosa]|nr:hypothetical protein SESBI_25693 [Sesbania bispinosa]